MKKLSFILCVLFVAFILFGCSSGTAGGSAAPYDASKVYAVGETVKLGQLELTVTKVEKTQGYANDVPKEKGDEFVVITVSFKNNDFYKPTYYGPTYFKLQDTQGGLRENIPSLYGEMDDLYSGVVTADEIVTGNLIFEEPVNAPGLVLVYTNESYTARFKIS